MHATAVMASCKVQRLLSAQHAETSKAQHARPAGAAVAAGRRALARRHPRHPVATHAAAAAPGPDHQPQPFLNPYEETPQLWSEIQLLARRAQGLESSGNVGEAADVLAAAVERLESQHGAAFSILALRQLLWDMLHSLGRHGEALEQAQRVADAVGTQFGPDSAELRLVSVRLGISTAACGALEEGIRIIYESTPVLQHNLGVMLQEAQQVGELLNQAGGEGGEEGSSASSASVGGEAGDEPLSMEELAEAAEMLQDNIDKVAAALGEGNFYGSLLTLRHAVACGQQEGVVQGWEQLERIVDNGFGSLVAASADVEGGNNIVANALREHDRLVQDLAGEALLTRLLEQQNKRLHDMAEQGMEHPLFQ